MIAAGPPRPDIPLHPDFHPRSIETMVLAFYAAIRADPRLGPVFEARIGGRWPAHLDRMTTFWSAVLLRRGGFKGQPVAVHRAMGEVVPDDYRIWMDLFRRNAAACFAPEPAALLVGAASRIAESLWLASFGDAFTSPPDWIRHRSPTANIEE